MMLQQVINKAKKAYIELWGNQWINAHKESICTDWIEVDDGYIVRFVQVEGLKDYPRESKPSKEEWKKRFSDILSHGDNYERKDNHRSSFMCNTETNDISLIQHW